uniref:CDGSH iron-sulfur domain-containing protein 3, mitochondrial n=4 Tax=Rhabditophanes sp. KR3021 TaxID=114890 RepID=A0AC35UEP7_9BILA
MLLNLVRSLRSSAVCLSNKTGFGPYRLHRKNTHFVGTEPSPLKYHVIAEKTAEQPYGLQGNNHLIESMGRVHSKLPTKVVLKKDKVYAWCSCGYSASQPLCDGSHKSVRTPKSNLKPVRYIPNEDREVWLCNCKQTKNRPFCDGSHSNLKEKDAKEGLFD